MLITLPSGDQEYPPIAPRTWVERVTGTSPGDAMTAPRLERDVSAAVIWHRQPALFQGIATATTSATSGTWTAIPLAGEIVDLAGGHADSGNTSRYQTPYTANTSAAVNDWYLCVGTLPWAAGTDPTKTYIAGVRVNGGANVIEGAKMPGTTGHPLTLQFADIVSCLGWDYVELMGWQGTGSPQSTTITGRTPALSVRWIGSDTGDTVALPAAPRTWTASDQITADSAGAGQVPLNLHIRDVIRWLHARPFARITSTGTTQTVANGGVWSSIQMPAATVDPYGMWSSGANTKLTCQKAGLYTVIGLGAVKEAYPASGYRAVRILHTIAAGGTAVYGGNTSLAATASAAGTALPVMTSIRMAAGDDLQLQVAHNETGSLSVKDGTYDASRLIAIWRSR